VLPVLVIPPCRRESPLECSQGDQAEVSADARAGEPVPVTELDGQGEPGQGRDPAHAAQAPGGRGELRVGRHRGDRLVEPVAAREGEVDRFAISLVGGSGAGLVEADRVEPHRVLGAPGSAAVVDVAVAQQQLRDPMPGPSKGLGLAVAHTVASAHGGRLMLDDRFPHGLRATLVIPRFGHAIE
jgi:hypothetical protein